MHRLTVLFALAALLPSTALAAGSSQSWAKREITQVTRQGIFAGTPATFRGSDALTRSSLAHVVAKLTDAKEKQVANRSAPVSIEQLDRSLVQALGLRDSAYRFYLAARRAQITPPRRFGSEVVARLIGLRLNHPAGQDDLELEPQQTATRAEAAYSVAQILGFGGNGGGGDYGNYPSGHHHGDWRYWHTSSAAATADYSSSWAVQSAQEASKEFELPTLTRWQRRIISTAFSYVGYPYVWGGTSFGFDCSGFVWRIYKLTTYPGEGNLASVLRGRTTMEMSGEVPRYRRINAKSLQPGDVMYFGHGRNSKPAQVDHAAIYLGNDWLIQSSGDGVAITRFDGWYRSSFAWGRRPLAEAGLA